MKNLLKTIKMLSYIGKDFFVENIEEQSGKEIRFLCNNEKYLLNMESGVLKEVRTQQMVPLEAKTVENIRASMEAMNSEQTEYASLFGIEI